MRPLPRTTETERWYRVRGKKRRPRVIWDTPEGPQPPPHEGKAAEGGRGSSPEGDVPTRTSQRRPGGSREGRLGAVVPEELPAPDQG